MSNANNDGRTPMLGGYELIKSMKNTGYKSTTHALAELIDNSIQAGADEVHVYLFSDDVKINTKYSERIVKIALLDNGVGMDAAVLEKSIGFGSGTRLGATDGLGKFGMGLSCASIAFNNETVVYSWQNGVDSALATYLSVERIKNGELYVPEPASVKIDNDLMQVASSSMYATGTLVVWSELSISPYRFDALAGKLEAMIGRIYRKFLHSGSVSIKIHDVYKGAERRSKQVLSNDPLYLMAPSCTPSPYQNDPMFALYEQEGEWIYHIDEVTSAGKNISGDVRVKISYVKSGLRTAYKKKEGRDAGNSLFGKHAKENVGYSICREGRELKLDPAFAKPSEATERWWGVEIDFDASLDEIFGVAFNKQDAKAVNEFHHWSWEDERIGNESSSEYQLRLMEEGDPRLPLIKLFDQISDKVAKVRTILKSDVDGDRKPSDGKEIDATRPEAIATVQAKKREEEGHPGETKGLEAPTPEELIAVAKEEGIQHDGQEHLVDMLRAGYKFSFEVGANHEAESFFSVRTTGSMMVVTMNSAHAFYEQVYEKLFVENEALTIEEQLASAQRGFKLTLLAWARLEDEAMSQAPAIRQNRKDWGRLLKDFLLKIDTES